MGPLNRFNQLGNQGKKMLRQRFLLTMITALVLFGCSHMGPKTVPRDRFDYNTAIADSWKEQTLLNIVKLRYLDMPLFVEVASVVSGYSLEGSVSIGGEAYSAGGGQGDFLSLGTTGKYTDRPTITYAPITGARFNENFMTPVPPKALLFLMQSGWPVDLIFTLTVDSVNGLQSRIFAGTDQRSGDPEYYDAIALLRKMQKSGSVSMRIIKGEGDKETTVVFFHQKNILPEIMAARQELHEILGLPLDDKELKVTFGLLPQADHEIAMLTRSILGIMVDLATQIDVPPEHVAKGFTAATLTAESSHEEDTARLIYIKHSTDKPENAFVAIKYEDYWFWIDKSDRRSKRSFGFLMILFSLTESGGKEGLPLVTIPAS